MPPSGRGAAAVLGAADAYLNSGIALSSSLVAPGRVILLSAEIFSESYGAATSRSPIPRKPPTEMTAYCFVPLLSRTMSSILPTVSLPSLTTELPMIFEARQPDATALVSTEAIDFEPSAPEPSAPELDG